MVAGIIPAVRNLATTLLLAVGSAAMATVAGASEIICLNPSGRAYYVESEIAAGSDAGWQNDGITGGIFTISLDGENVSRPFSITVTDVTGSTFSVADEAELTLSHISAESGTIRLDADYSGGHTETYLITDANTRSPTLLMTIVRADGPLPSSKIFVASCAAR